ncbi:unnamed protein product [Bursaphelenchus okinawaensis]|uniref:Poly(A) RNA polymerase mitochondrial-like central palm domain-containing protein n=1 Tax=Bursaphelenchus okinawaensis TaxID=465554 RepID=A0A811LBJ9_9BILA|nr:unnamed protein product [Bursaphelenchus okinawaensis]CAG9119952.1 unnamed protein product [Bursaphelenchus okinawaensis]
MKLFDHKFQLLERLKKVKFFKVIFKVVCKANEPEESSSKSLQTRIEHEFDEDKEEAYQDLQAYLASMNTHKTSLDIKIINQKLEEVYNRKQPPEHVVDSSLYLYHTFREQIIKLYKKVDVYVFGSSVNGFGSLESDIDLTIVGLNHIQMRRGPEGVLEDVRDYLMEKNNQAETGLIKAKLVGRSRPLIKMTCEHHGHTYELDLGIGSRQGIANSVLLNCYARMDKRVRMLGMMVKEWAKRRRLYGGYFQRFNSFTIAVLVIHYLQQGVQPSLLPNLHESNPTIFNVQFNIDPIESIQEIIVDFDPSLQEKTLIELFFGFVNYYSSFDFNQVIRIHKTEGSSGYGSDDDVCNCRLNIEDPCGGRNPARAVSPECFNSFKLALARIRHCKWFDIYENPQTFNPRTHDLDVKTLLNFFGADMDQEDTIRTVLSDDLYRNMYPLQPHMFCS